MLQPNQIDPADWTQDNSGQLVSVSALLKRVTATAALSSSSRPSTGDAVITMSSYAENSTGSGIYPIRRSDDIKSCKQDERECTSDTHDDDDDSASRPLLAALKSQESNSLSATQLDSQQSISNVAESRVSAMFLLVQGLFAGFSFVTLFVSTDSSGATGVATEAFLLSYSDRAGQIRRFMYLLSSLSLIGSLDSLLASLNTNDTSIDRKGLNREERLYRLSRISISALSSFLYLLAFLATTIMSKTDTLLTMHYGLTNSNMEPWSQQVLQSSSFQSHIVIWLGLDRCRLITATIAWCLSCVLVYGELRARYRLELRRLRTEQTLKQWRWKVDELSGQPDVFEPLMRIQAGERMALSAASGSLRKLIAMHQIGIERTQEALQVIMERLDNPST